MHPIASHQIATLKAAELRREADRHNARAPARRFPGRDDAPTAARTPLARVWAVVTRAPRTT